MGSYGGAIPGYVTTRGVDSCENMTDWNCHDGPNNGIPLFHVAQAIPQFVHDPSLLGQSVSYSFPYSRLAGYPYNDSDQLQPGAVYLNSPLPVESELQALGHQPNVPLSNHPPASPGSTTRPSKPTWTKEHVEALVSLRQAGKGFAEISQEMRTRFGFEISPNALVKRFQKLQEQYHEPLPEVIRNAMPEIMTVIRAAVAKMENEESMSDEERKALQEIVNELPQSIPKMVQNSVLRKRKAQTLA
ncbi:hypothetical protein OQA88_12604 [Cercophora sp. LCS_1]